MEPAQPYTGAGELDIDEAVTTEKSLEDIMEIADELTTEPFFVEPDQTSPTVEDYYDIDEKSTPSPIDHRPLKPVDIPVKVFTTKKHIPVLRIERKLFNKAVPIIVIVVHLVLAAIVVLVLKFKKF
ncbi:hypothetical protein RF11_07313 [Thelohanellus kitauei]|uniref:Uncharacterized protein n=1 Tax=Thelohanellus kitauei TaxID=669202 RepID=A0A0C2MKF9_THEKT|nr:hypothetical protein RF11_07313 [Thelohanellus kitauei]